MEEHICWLFFNIFLPLTPLLLVMFVVHVSILTTRATTILKDGQLFFFSAALSASSLGSLLLNETQSHILKAALLCADILVLFVSAGLFTLASFLKLREMDFELHENRFCNYSIYCAGFASVLGYMTFYVGRLP